jgi:hypothetical protein
MDARESILASQRVTAYSVMDFMSKVNFVVHPFSRRRIAGAVPMTG